MISFILRAFLTYDHSPSKTCLFILLLLGRTGVYRVGGNMTAGKQVNIV